MIRIPARVVAQPALLASIPLPANDYPADGVALGGRGVHECGLSQLQLEGVLYAAQRHRTLLPGVPPPPYGRLKDEASAPRHTGVSAAVVYTRRTRPRPTTSCAGPTTAPIRAQAATRAPASSTRVHSSAILDFVVTRVHSSAGMCRTLLPGGDARAGFFIGDGAGIGKGRQIAGAILDAACRGARAFPPFPRRRPWASRRVCRARIRRRANRRAHRPYKRTQRGVCEYERRAGVAPPPLLPHDSSRPRAPLLRRAAVCPPPVLSLRWRLWVAVVAVSVAVAVAVGVGRGRGAAKHIWISVSADLCADASRDLSDVGCHLPLVNGCKARAARRGGARAALRARRERARVARSHAVTSLSFVLSRSLSFSLILSRSLSFSLILSRSLSFALVLSHSLSFSLVLSRSLSRGGWQGLDAGTKGLQSASAHGVLFLTYAGLISSVARRGMAGAKEARRTRANPGAQAARRWLRSERRRRRRAISPVTRAPPCIVSPSRRPQARLEQIVRWAGGADFAGVLTFDECHKAKNFDTKNEEKSTKMAQAVIELQRQMPMARRRAIDCSARFGRSARRCEEAISLRTAR